MTGSTQDKGSGATAVESVETKQKVEAGLAKKGTGAEAGDSPKRQGDKLEHATQAAAGRPERS